MKLRFLVSIALLFIIAITVGAQDADYPTITGVATDEAIEFPEEVPAGFVKLVFENNRSEAGFTAVVARINDGISVEDFMAAASAENPMEALSMVSLYGGMNTAPGESTGYTVNLSAGNYLLLEFGEAGPSDFKTFTVTEGDMMDMAAPQADVHLAMVDFAFGVPGFMPAGEQLWHLENVGDQWHETVIIPLPEGIESVSDVLEAMASDDQPDIQPVLFWAPMSPGTEAWVTVDLAPGNYVILCFLPDLNGDFSPHMNHGMVQVFIVQ